MFVTAIVTIQRTTQMPEKTFMNMSTRDLISLSLGKTNMYFTEQCGLINNGGLEVINVGDT